MSPVISVQNLSKKYILSHQSQERYTALRDVIAKSVRNAAQKLRNPFSEPSIDATHEEFWALKDVSFDIQQGDRIGIIGRNGAGKSTLLKVLSRIVEPSEGSVKIRGRVASLLEVGTGFHPELTGRENIYLNGAILGMSKAEIKQKFDEIVAFAEVEKFLDTPVKRYSSGMYVRLAFAVAAHLEPEILIVDEVLAVGDLQFQRKCMGKIEDVGKQGRTVLFVSHNMAAIGALCSKAILLRQGQLAAMGDVSYVALEYLKGDDSNEFALPVVANELIINQYDILQKDAPVDHIDGDQSFVVKVGFEILEAVSAFRLGIYLKLPTGETVFRSFLADWDAELEEMDKGAYEVQLLIPANLLASGDYQILLHASRYGIKDYLHKYGLVKNITIYASSKFNQAHLNEKFDAYILMAEKWTVKRS